MNTLFLLTLIAIFFNSHFFIYDYNADYMNPSSTQSVSGIFVLLVFLNHFRGYSSFQNVGIYPLFSRLLGQLIVAPFLFYSGYGIMTSLEQKGQMYIYHFPFKRIFRVWYHFAVALCFYLVAGLASGSSYHPLELIFAFLGLSSIGNSNWFVWTILWLYLFTWIAAIAARKSNHVFLGLLSILILLYMYIMSRIAPLYYYDTAFVYLAGMLYACYQHQAESFMNESSGRFRACFLFLCLSYAVSFFWRTQTHFLLSYIPWCLSFSGLFIMITMKVRFQNRILSFLGEHVFEIYILQRLPMNLLERNIQNDYVLALLCAVLTGVMAAAFHKLLLILDQRLGIV